MLELDPDNNMEVKKTYIYANSEILAQHNGFASSADANFYLHDRLGSVREVIDKNAVVKKYFTYDPFGKTREFYGPTNGGYPFMFTGQYYDSEIGQYYLRARMYDPQMMRFIARDELNKW